MQIWYRCSFELFDVLLLFFFPCLAIYQRWYSIQNFEILLRLSLFFFTVFRSMFQFTFPRPDYYLYEFLIVIFVFKTWYSPFYSSLYFLLYVQFELWFFNDTILCRMCNLCTEFSFECCCERSIKIMYFVWNDFRWLTAHTNKK